MLAALWAEDLQGVIGKDQTLPWHLPNDLKYFKEMTIGKTIVMGRTTFEGMGSRPLPNRQTIVLTRNPDYQAEGVTVMHSVDDVLAYAKTKEEPTMIIGGAVVFQDFLPYYDLLYRTVIEENFSGDTYFPSINWNEWELRTWKQGVTDEKNKYAHRFETYRRKNKNSTSK
ncbi:dihydrofolate reductase [Enterococcus sp. DIV1314a]|uniref:dihydrofolate reductase n=1 Tax=Enterococcus sp. DIV1314a TaxID=2774660 RepID=UPI003F2593F6